MKNRLMVVGLLLSVAACRTGLVAEDCSSPSQLTLTLVDDSRVIGSPAIVALPFKSDFASIRIPFDKVLSVQMQPGRSNAVVCLKNGDRLTGIPEIESLGLTTLFGPQHIALSFIKRIDVRKAGSLDPALVGSLVLHYTFDRDEQNRVTDLSDKGNHGTVFGGARFTPEGKNGGGMLFDGVDGYVDAGNGPSLQLTKDFTLSLWICPEPKLGGRAFLMKSFGYPEQQRRAIEFALGDDDTWGGYFWDDSARYFSGIVTNSLLRGEIWSHVVLMHDSSMPDHQMRAFLNGAPVPLSFAYETVSSIPTVRTVQEPLRLGCMRPGSHLFKGRMDEVMILNRCLSPQEIEQLYRSTR